MIARICPKKSLQNYKCVLHNQCLIVNLEEPVLLGEEDRDIAQDPVEALGQVGDVARAVRVR